MQALTRLLAILEAIAHAPNSLSATEVARTTGLSLSTATRLLHQLEAEAVVDRSERDGKYTVGWRLVTIARSGSDRFNLRDSARPVLERLRDATQETVSLHTRTGSSRLCIAAAQSPQAVARVVSVGLSLDLLGSATGIVLLSDGSREEVQGLFPGLSAEEWDALDAATALVRERGWVVVSDTWQSGVTGISTAIRDASGNVVLALSISGPSLRFGPKVARGCEAELAKAASEVSDLYQSLL